jgi:4-amino-4-deoxy-L-arabinose transferase-like glycosyltransferase
MTIRWRPFLTLSLLFVIAGGLMAGAMRQESATVDETGVLGGGYSYWLGHRYWFKPDSPPLAQLLAALPLTTLDVKLTPLADAVVNGRLLADPGTRWDLREGGPPLRTGELFPHGPNFYHYPWDEQKAFGEELVYGGQNDAEKLLFWGRIPEVLITILTGLLVYLEARRMQGVWAGVLGAAMFLLNPVILAHGHIIHTDIGVTFTYALAVMLFARLLESHRVRDAVWAGLATGLAFATKFTAVILVPTFVILWLLCRWRYRETKATNWKHWLIVAGVAWGVLMLVYAPHWTPAPPIDPITADKLGVPHWFTAYRPLLIPAAYFKGLAMTTPLFASVGLGSYLNGVWSATGWWYYYPAAFAMKSPLPFLAFLAAGIVLAVRFRRNLRTSELAAWAAVIFYFVCASRSKTDIGVRHVLPVYPLLSIAAACALARWGKLVPSAPVRPFRLWGIGTLPVWALAVVLLASPAFLSYLNPLAGGTEQGYRRLLDSNYDWGQDFIRLRKFLDERKIDKVYLAAFGDEAAIEYYKIPCEYVTPETAQQIRQGYLVISVHLLMRPEWNWLRESQPPVARVGYTLFVYRFGEPKAE